MANTTELNIAADGLIKNSLNFADNRKDLEVVTTPIFIQDKE